MTGSVRRLGFLAQRRQLAVTWTIPDEYGGMTAALLRRSRLFAQAGARAEVITFDPRPDYERIREQLAARGELAGGVVLRNIYEDFRRSDRAATPVAEAPVRFADPPTDVVRGDGGSVARWLEGHTVMGVEHYRADGSIAVQERLLSAAASRRIVTVFDSDERPTGQWRSVRRFRFAWLDELLDGEPAAAIVDSKTAARWMQHYNRDNVTRIHMVHGAHHDASGRLTPGRRDIFEHLDRWHGIAFLTERQRAAALASLGDSGNLAVVPNVVTLPDAPPQPNPERLHGVIASLLSRRKRLDHALEVIARVRADGVPVTLDIIGDGPDRARLERDAARLGLTDAVRFHGYARGGAAHFRSASWTLLTSRAEGQPLALLEAMGSGCVPVAYDIAYGPSDTIRDGRSGFLVPDGDIAAATAALKALCGLPDAEFEKMRTAARRTLRDYTERAVLTRWAGAQRDAVRRQAKARRVGRPSLVRRAARAARRISRAAARALRGSTPRRR